MEETFEKKYKKKESDVSEKNTCNKEDTSQIFYRPYVTSANPISSYKQPTNNPILSYLSSYYLPRFSFQPPLEIALKHAFYKPLFHDNFLSNNYFNKPYSQN